MTDSHTCNKLVTCFCHGFLNPYKLQHIQTVSIPSVLSEETASKLKLGKASSAHAIPSRGGVRRRGSTWASRVEGLEAGGPSVGLCQLGGPSPPPVLRASLPPTLDQPVLPSNAERLPAPLLQRRGQNLETGKPTLEKAGKREAAPGEARPGPALPAGTGTRSPHRPHALAFPSGGFLRRGGASTGFQVTMESTMSHLLSTEAHSGKETSSLTLSH